MSEFAHLDVSDDDDNDKNQLAALPTIPCETSRYNYKRIEWKTSNLCDLNNAAAAKEITADFTHDVISTAASYFFRVFNASSGIDRLNR